MSHEKLPLKLLTERQLAEAIAVSPRTARRLRARKILPFYRLGKGLIRYDQGQCVKALNSYRVAAHRENCSGTDPT
jgi:hypothetical protein